MFPNFNYVLDKWARFSVPLVSEIRENMRKYKHPSVYWLGLLLPLSPSSDATRARRLVSCPAAAARRLLTAWCTRGLCQGCEHSHPVRNGLYSPGCLSLPFLPASSCAWESSLTTRVVCAPDGAAPCSCLDNVLPL